MHVQRWVWTVLLAGCAVKTDTRPPERPVVSEAEEETADPALWAVADAVDPGPQRPLFEGLPRWLKDRLGAPADRTVAVKEIRDALMAWDKQRSTQAQDYLTALLAVGRGLVLAEQAVAGGVDDPELLLALSRSYAILSTPVFANEQGMFQQILQFMVAASSQLKDADGVQVSEVIAALRDVFARAPKLHRRTAAELLRRHGDHPEVPRVLGRLADDDAANGRFHGALELRRLAMARLGKRADGVDHLDLAWTCYRALDAACGDEALARAQQLGSNKPDDAGAVAGFKTRVEKLGETAGQVRRLAELTADARVKDAKHADLTPALERGHLLVLLGHHADAKAHYEALRAAHPGDARPLAGLAKVALSDGVNIAGSAAYIEQGRKLANRDRDYYEVALGVFGSKLLTEVMPSVMKDPKATPQGVMKSLLDDMREYATGLQQYDAARAGVVLALEEIARAAMPMLDDKNANLGAAAIRSLEAKTTALSLKFPESADVRRLMFLAAKTSEERSQGLALVRAPLAGELGKDAATQRARLQAWLDVTIQWDEAAELGPIVKAMEAQPAIGNDWPRTTLLAVAQALQFKVNGDRAAGQAAREAFERVAADPEAQAEVRHAALCNSGVLLSWLGEDEAARARFEQVLEQFPGSRPALVNIAALYTKHGTLEPKLSEIFEVVGREGESAALRTHAHAWRYTQAKAGLGDVEVARRGFLEAVAKTDKATVVAPTIDRWGAYTSGSWNLSLQYQASSGFQIVNQLSSTAWLVLVSPDLGELAAAAEAAVKKPGKKAAKQPAKKPAK